MRKSEMSPETKIKFGSAHNSCYWWVEGREEGTLEVDLRRKQTH